MALAHPVDDGGPIEDSIEPEISRAASAAKAVTAVTAKAVTVVTDGPAWHAFQLLHWTFVILPIVAGTNRFFELSGPHPTSPASLFADLLGVSLRSVTCAVGVGEIALGIIVAFTPWIGGWLVAAWLGVAVVTQWLVAGSVDVVLHDTALSVGALALSRLASQFDGALSLVAQSAEPEPTREQPPIAA